MRRISFEQACRTGGHPHTIDMPVNSPNLRRAFNRMVTERGLKPIPLLPYPITNVDESFAWPHPQILHAKRRTLLFHATTIHTVNSNLSASAITTYNGINQSTTKAIPSGAGVWQVAAFHDVWFATKGNAFVWYAPSNLSGRVCIVDSALSVGAVCEHQGRLFLGGIGGSNVTGSEWLELFAHWKTHSPMGVTTHASAGWDTGWIMYGPPGGMDSEIPHAQVLAAFSIPSASIYAKFRDELFSLVADGTIGFVPIERAGAVRVLKTYGDSVIAYCENCVVRLTQTEQGRWGESGRISDQGVPTRGAVAGTDTEHFAVLNSRSILHGQLNQGWQNRGYDQSFLFYNMANMVVVHDPTERTTWFTDGDYTSMIARVKPDATWGVGISNAVRPSSVLRIGSTLYGTAVREDDPQPAIIETATFDSGTRNVFQTLWVDVRAVDTDTTGLTAHVGATKDKGQPLTYFQSDAVPVDPRGRARVATSGVEMALVLEHPDHTKLGTVDYIDAVITEGDARHSDAKWYEV